MYSLKDFLQNPYSIFRKLSLKGLLNFLPDKVVIPLLYRGAHGKSIDLDHPVTFDEKLQWCKLYDRNPLYTSMADKCDAKKVIADRVGPEYVIPTLGVWDDFSQIDFSQLPDQFVLKTTHDSGGVVICKDKKTFNVEKARKNLEPRLKQNFYFQNREWVYKNIKPRIIAETYMEDRKTGELRDYKFYCFNGFAKALLLATNRQSETDVLRFDYFDRDFNHLDLTNHWHPNADTIPEKPANFELMVQIAEKISVGFPHVRVDFYEADNKIYIGEFTFYDMAGHLKIHPEAWEKEWGDLIDLSLAYNYDEWKSRK